MYRELPSVVAERFWTCRREKCVFEGEDGAGGSVGVGEGIGRFTVFCEDDFIDADDAPFDVVSFPFFVLS